MDSVTNKVYVGIDVHSREHSVAVIPLNTLEKCGTEWTEVKTFKVRNDDEDFVRLNTIISSYVKNINEVTIGIDNAGDYSKPITYFLVNMRYRVCYLDSKGAKAIREKLLNYENKSDSIDCRSIAYILYLIELHGLSSHIQVAVPHLESKASALNAVVTQRNQFNKLVVQTTNRLHQLLLAVFPEGERKYFKKLLKIAPYYPTPKDILASLDLSKVNGLSSKDREAILQLAERTVGVPGDIYQHIIIELANQRIEAKLKCEYLKSVLKQQVVNHPYGSILLSFPHLGEVCAATIIGIVKDINRWPNKKTFKKMLGVYAVSSQSGQKDLMSKQGRGGNRRGRRVLFQICFGCITENARENDFKDYYRRQVKHNKPRMKALVSTMGKLAEIIYHCLKNNELYEYQSKYRIYSTKPNQMMD